MKIPTGAFWIGSDHPFDLHESYLNFCREFELGAPPKELRFHVTADSRYRLWFNGVPVAYGPARSWPHHQQLDMIDVAQHARKGTNRIAVQVYSPGYSHFAYLHRGACGLLCWLEADGKPLLVSDSRWRVKRDTSWSAEVPRISIYGSGAEHRDMRLAEDWREAPLDESWKVPRILQPPEGPIWQGLHRRSLPLLASKTHELDVPWRFQRGIHRPGTSDPHLWLRQAVRALPIAAVPAGRQISLSEGETALWIFDLGISKTGRVHIQIGEAQGGEILLTGYAEKLREGDVLLSDPSTYCRMRVTDRFTLREGKQVVEPFTPRGGRYLLLLLSAANGLSTDLTFQFEELLCPIELSQSLKSKESELRAIQQLCQRTILATLLDGFVDSVWRESSQWLGDAVAQAFALRAISNDLRPLRQVITMAAQGACADGVLPSVLPGEVHAYTVTDYNFSWVELLDMYIQWSRPREAEAMLAAQLPVLQRMLDRFAADVGRDGLIRSQLGRRLFLDWSPVSREEPSLTYNGRYLYALQLAVTLARRAGKRTFAAELAKREAALRRAISKNFRHKGQWRENPQRETASQLGLALVLLTGTATKPEYQTLADAIVARSLDLDDEHAKGKLVLASPFMHHYVFLGLEKVGRAQDILSIIRARWGRWARAGEPTCWENWNVDFPDGSTCHGFSAHPLGWIKKLS